MKLISKEICPVTVRDRLIRTFSNQDVCDLVEAVKWAEAKCLELNEKNKIWLKALNVKEELNERLRCEIEDLKKKTNAS